MKMNYYGFTFVLSCKLVGERHPSISVHCFHTILNQLLILSGTIFGDLVLLLKKVFGETDLLYF